MLSDIHKKTDWFEGTQVSLISSDKRSSKMKMSMQYWWNDIDRRKQKYPNKNQFQCYYFSIHLTLMDPKSNTGLCVGRPATEIHLTISIYKNASSYLTEGNRNFHYIGQNFIVDCESNEARKYTFW